MKTIYHIIGNRFGRLIVESEYPYESDSKFKKKKFICRCDCGNEVTSTSSNLRSGNTKSCGCLHKDAVAKALTTHGKTLTPEYRIWNDMIMRCFNKNRRGYVDYGGRGITVCDRWRKFSEFHSDMGDRPSKYHSLDRINNDGDYAPDNCRWATNKEQCRNRRSSRVITINGVSMNYRDWEIKMGLSRGLIHSRISALGWSDEEAVMGKGVKP